MRSKKWLALFTATMVMLSTMVGCGGNTSPAAGEGNSEEVAKKQNEVTLNDKIIDEIKERGYLNVGCKMDVPNLSYYEEAEDTWSGLEIELAYQTAANIFEVDIDQAKKDDLVHFTGVTVKDREEVLEAGDIDCMLATYTITEERSERFAISDSYYTDYVGLMVRADKAANDSSSLGGDGIHSTADLDGKYIGVPKNATTRTAFIDYIKSMNNASIHPIFCEFESYEELYNALINGNIDAMSVDVSILNGYVDEKTIILSDRFAGQHYGAATLKENALILDYVNLAIEK